MMPLTGKERRKYLEALKEKNARGEHISSDPAGLLLRKGKKEQGTAGEMPGGDASGSSQKDAGKDNQSEQDAVAEVDAAYRQSLWHQDFRYQQYMEVNVPFAAVDEDASFHAKFSELAQDAGTGALRSLVYMHAMERKYDALEKQLQEAMKDVEKHKHQAAAFEERVEGLLLDKSKVEEALSGLELEKTCWLSEKGVFEEKVGNLEKQLTDAKDEVEGCKMAMVSQFEEGFERAKVQVAFLYPGLDLSALDSLKIVQDGELIDEP